MFTKKLEQGFIAAIFFGIAILGLNSYKDYTFKNNDIPESYKQRIQAKEQDVLEHMQKNFGFLFQVPLIVTDKIQGRLYGLTAYENGNIKIYLNKNVMQESMDYMIESVIAHEYAHALLFKLGRYNSADDGHSELWKQTCIKLGGADCQQYVDQHEVIMAKMPFQ
jgi:SprT protein